MTNQLRGRVLSDLARSGLTAAYAKRLGVAPVSEEKTTALTGWRGTAAYRIPYYDIEGKATKFARLRFLDPPTTKDGKTVRYWQPPDSAPQLYFPPLVRWKDAVKNPEETLYITEGEKKAARACASGLPCIGLGGVWSWRSAKRGVPLIDDFKKINFEGRAVVVVFDSDVHEKVEVQQALTMLARELVRMGAQPFTVKLPSSNGNKVGLDDYLEDKGLVAFHQLGREQLLGALGEELWKLNEELAYIEESEAVMRLKTGALLSPQSLVSLAYANRRVAVATDNAVKQVSVAAEWLRWEFRRTHRAITYAPGRPTITEDNRLNVWQGWGVEPKKGDITPWARLMEFMFKSSPQHLQWFLQWLAYPLQHPGSKMYAAAVLFSLGEGLGKSLVGVTMGEVYGRNFSSISQRELYGAFNEWAVGKQFVLGDDVTGSDKRDIMDVLKTMISREKMHVNRKYQPTYEVPDRINYLFTTNQPDAFLLGNKDRRYFVHEIVGDPLPDSFYRDYDRWLWHGGGPAHLFWHLRENIDVSEFNPKAKAPMTDAKRDMMELSRGDLDGWAHTIVGEGPKVDGRLVDRTLWTTQELVALYDPGGQKKTTLIAMSKALRRAGFRPLDVTRTLRDGSKRLWAVRDAERWRRADHHERVQQYEKERVAEPEKKAKF